MTYEQKSLACIRVGTFIFSEDIIIIIIIINYDAYSGGRLTSIKGLKTTKIDPSSFDLKRRIVQST